MRTTTSTIGTRLDIYGPRVCLVCGGPIATLALACRRHPGHPEGGRLPKHERVVIDLDELARETVSV